MRCTPSNATRAAGSLPPRALAALVCLVCGLAPLVAGVIRASLPPDLPLFAAPGLISALVSLPLFTRLWRGAYAVRLSIA